MPDTADVVLTLPREQLEQRLDGLGAALLIARADTAACTVPGCEACAALARPVDLALTRRARAVVPREHLEHAFEQAAKAIATAVVSPDADRCPAGGKLAGAVLDAMAEGY